MQLFRKTFYEVKIAFKSGANRRDIVGLVERGEYKRLLEEIRRGFEKSTYKITIEGHETEKTFPVQEIDTITALPVIEVDNGS